MSLRLWAEHLSRGVVLRRRLPREFKALPIYVTPEAGLRYWRRDLRKVDAMLLRMVRELVAPGSVVWDVGANVGLFAFSAAALAGPSGTVLAVEPDLWLAQLLTRSARQIKKQAKSVASLTVLPAAVCETNRIGQLHIAERARSANHLVESHGSTQAGGPRATQNIVTVSLDFLLEHFPSPSVLKIDVENAEVGVLTGASKLLRTARPTIWCEVHPENSMKVAEMLLDSGYQIYAAALDPEKRTPLKRASWDTLAVPSPS
jgi:FkbM family methyltransferase